VATLAAARWGWFLLLMAPYSAFYFLVDAFVVQQAVSWFNVRVPYRDILPVRATTYILSLLNTQLGQGGVAVYLHRRYGIPFWEVTGTVVFMMFVEVYQLALYSFVGGAAGGELGRGVPLAVYALLAGYLVLHLWYFSRPRGGRLASVRILDAFRRARPSHYARLLLYKTPNLLVAVTVYWLALPLFGMHVPFVAVLAYLPVVFFFAALPIAAAHLGPSQAAWIYFFGRWAPGDQILGFSFAAHFTFMLMNALIGLTFLPRAARELGRGAETRAAPAPPSG
jgi:hypothetical protein